MTLATVPPDTAKAHLTIREMCEAFNVTPRALRFYESKELLTPIRKGQRRLYTRRERARLTLILRGKRFGLSLEEIRQLLELYARDNRNEAQLRQACQIARVRLEQMCAQRDELDLAIADLTSELTWGEAELVRLGQAKAAE